MGKAYKMKKCTILFQVTEDLNKLIEFERARRRMTKREFLTAIIKNHFREQGREVF